MEQRLHKRTEFKVMLLTGINDLSVSQSVSSLSLNADRNLPYEGMASGNRHHAFFVLWRMAQYEHLPVYKKAMDLAVYIENVVKGFSRYHKYTIGADLRNLSREVVKLIIVANSREDKLQSLTELRDMIEQLKVTIINMQGSEGV